MSFTRPWIGLLTALLLTACQSGQPNQITGPGQPASLTESARPARGAAPIAPVPGLMLDPYLLSALELSPEQSSQITALSQSLSQAATEYQTILGRHLAAGAALEQSLQQSFGDTSFNPDDLEPLIASMLGEADPQLLSAQTDYLLAAYALLSPEQRSIMIQAQQNLEIQRANRAMLDTEMPLQLSYERQANQELTQQLLMQLAEATPQRASIASLLSRLAFGAERQTRLVQYLDDLHSLLTPAQRGQWLELIKSHPDRLQQSLGSQLGGFMGPPPLN